jgi:ABC-type nitrate/sulfonate/bicarbonate transport system substrate-binding protein
MPSKPLDLARTLAAAACIACALQPLAASAQAADKPEKTDVKVCLGWTFVATQAPFPYGVDQGFFKAAGLDVTVDRGAGAGSSPSTTPNIRTGPSWPSTSRRTNRRSR